MAYTWEPHPYDFSDYYEIEKGDTGLKVAVLQLNLPALVIDGDFGDATHAAVGDFQSSKGLVADGKAGYFTQKAIIKQQAREAADSVGIRVGIISGIAEKESNFALAAYSDHPSDWGYDLGALQNSIGPDGDSATQDNYEFSYNVKRMAARTAQEVENAFLKFRPLVTRSWYSDFLVPDGDTYLKNRFCYQMAVFNHNWPTAATNIARLGHMWGPYVSSDPNFDDIPRQWIIDYTKGRLKTPRQWAVDYVQSATKEIKW